MKQSAKSGLKPWKPGQSGNPAGRPVGARSKFSEDVVTALAIEWATHSDTVLADVRKDDPSTWLRVMASLIPKEMAVSVNHSIRPLQSLEPGEWSLLILLAETIRANMPADMTAPPRELLQAIAETTAAYFAKPVSEASGSEASDP